jgi:uncharacterized protein YbgA (DUF1722 family)/uncharacterized protein YbbK (DUF523 family)
MDGKIKVGVSTCLLGERVRYDGSHKLDRFLTDTLGRYFTYVPVCPEVECGLPVPRESMRLVGDPAKPRLVTRKSGADHTVLMKTWAAKRIEQLKGEGLCAFIFKADSPSSGLCRVKLYNEKGDQSGITVGLWARAFSTAFPRLPMEEDGRLHDPDIRENFIERVFALKRFRDEVARAPRAAALVQFQTHNKLLIMAHAPAAAAELGRLTAQAAKNPVAASEAYERWLLEALTEQATVPRHVNVLLHMQGYFKDTLSADERLELTGVIEDYGKELVPLIAPITLFKHFIRKYGVAYLAGQTYLNPHPMELKLRNHA